METKIQSVSDFQSLPLGEIIGRPLKAAVEAQKIAAEATNSALQGLLHGNKNGDCTDSNPMFFDQFLRFDTPSAICALRVRVPFGYSTTLFY
jgi:hypothetical protein